MTNGTVLVLVIHDPFLERCIVDGFDRELLDLVSCWTSNVLQDDVLQGGTRRLFLRDAGRGKPLRVTKISLRGALATRAASQCASNRIKPHRTPQTER